MNSALRWLIACALIIVGVVLLLNTLGIASIDPGDVIGVAFAVLLILLGVALLRRSRRTRSGVQFDHFTGSERVGAGWDGGDASYQMGFGELIVDLSAGKPQDGEHTLTVNGLIGRLEVILSKDVAVSAKADVMAGSARIADKESGGLVRTLSWESPGYAAAVAKLRLDIELTIGEVVVRQVA
jgi:lia operon protein LiaF